MAGGGRELISSRKLIVNSQQAKYTRNREKRNRLQCEY